VSGAFKWSVFLCVLAGSVYLLLWPVVIEPEAWTVPKDNGYTGSFSKNHALLPLSFYPIPDDSGPEDFALHTDGRLFVSLHSGTIAIFDPVAETLLPWVNTQGRPLGMEFDRQGNLIVADAYKGLLSVDPSGAISLLTNQVANSPILYADDLDIADNGKIYFTDASTRFSPAIHGGTLAASLLDIMEHSANGRLLEYDPNTAKTRVVLDKINFANGVAVSHEQTAVLVIETGSYRVLKVDITEANFGHSEVVIDNLPGFPDNLARGLNNTYWLGLASPRNALLDEMSDKPFMRKLVQRLPAWLRPKPEQYGHVVQIDGVGTVLQSLQDPSGSYSLTTGVTETETHLYISSLTEASIAVKSKN